MDLTRRNMMVLGSGAFLATGLGSLPAFASATDDAIAAFTGGAEVGEGGVDAERAGDRGERQHRADRGRGPRCCRRSCSWPTGNPTPRRRDFQVRPAERRRGAASTRIRLAGTQNVIAIAKMDDGSFSKAQAAVKVTIGGCGG